MPTGRAPYTAEEIAAGPELAAQNALLQAGAYLEMASHAGTEGDCWCALGAASDRLHWALADLGIVGDEDQLHLAQMLTATVDGLVALGGVPAGSDLATFQLSLLPLQSQVVEVMAQPVAAWASAQDAADSSASLALLGVLGVLGVYLGAAGYIDYKQTRGGYGRGAPGVARPLVAYRYPRG